MFCVKARKEYKYAIFGFGFLSLLKQARSSNYCLLVIWSHCLYIVSGDTTFEVFRDSVYTPPPDLFRVKLLIVEATYIDDECELTDRVEQARQWGHIHLCELYENADMFKNVDNILLMHISDKYSVQYIQEKVFSDVPEQLKGKVHVATVAKERYL